MNVEIKSLIESCIYEFFQLNEVESRIQHAEDLVFWEGSKGALRSVKSIVDLEKGGHQNLTIKWDGSPAVIFGRNQDGKFILTDKSGFSAKGYDGRSKSGEELEKMFLNRGKVGSSDKSEEYKLFASNMKNVFKIFESAVPLDFRGFFKGDLLFFNRPSISDGKFVFKPNVVTYSVSVESDLGRRIQKSLAAVVIHRVVDEVGVESSIRDFSMFMGTNLLVIPPITIQSPPIVDKSKARVLLNLIKSKGPSIDKLLDGSTLNNMRLSDFPDILYTYTNSKVDTGLENLGNDFLRWLKTSKVSDNKKTKIEEYININKQPFESMWEIVRGIMMLKDDIIFQLDNRENYIQASIGSHSGGEGYVLSHPDGDIKFVSRSGFSAANRSLRRESLFMEGGNVFKSTSGSPDTVRINKLDVEPTVKWLERVTGLNLIDNMLGTTGKKESSGDLDLAVDGSKISKDELVNRLSSWANKNNQVPKDIIKKTGDSVHFKTPISGNSVNGYVQTDFMFGDPTWMIWSMRGGQDKSEYKGMYRHVLLASIAKYKNFKWSYKNGLVDRETNKIVSKNPADISVILLGNDAVSSDLDYFETILNKIKNNKDYEKMVSDARDTLLKYGIKF